MVVLILIMKSDNSAFLELSNFNDGYFYRKATKIGYLIDFR